MKILMLGWELPPYNSGGLGVACYHMAKALASHGAAIDFVLPHVAPEHNEIDFMKISPVTAVSVSEIDLKKLNAYENGHIESIRALQKNYVKYIREKVKKDRPDVIHAHDWLTIEAGIAAKQVSRAPLIVHVHATEFDRAGAKSGNPIIHEIEEAGLLMADRIFAVSELTKQLIVSGYGIPADKIEVVHNSIDQLEHPPVMNTDMYSYLELMRAEGYTVVSTLGRLTVQKGLAHFLRSAARASHLYDKFLFIIAGDGEQKEELIRLSADLGIADKVLFTGFVRGEAWRQLYKVTDVFVMSSVSEPFGLTALEAAAHDTAIILTNQSGVAEVMKNILRYDYWDESKLADQLINIAVSSGLKDSLIAGAHDEFCNMSWDSVAKKCFHHYRQMVRVAA